MFIKEEIDLKNSLFIVLAALLICASLLTSCSSKKDPNVPDGMTIKENNAVEYYFYYPEEWVIDRNDGMVSVYVSDKDRSNVSVTTFTAPADIANVEDYLKEEYLGYVEENFTDMKILSDGEKVTLGNIDARKYVFTATVAGNEYKFMQIITYRYVHILTYTSTASGFDTHIDDVNNIVKAFEFKTK